MTHDNLALQLFNELCDVPLLDVHTHLVGGKLGARGLHDIFLYHMVISDLYAAGCPNGARLTQYPGTPSEAEAHARIREALPYVGKIVNTSMYWGLRLLLSQLYDWDEGITEDNWERLDAIIRERADDAGWQRDVMQRANIKRFCTEYARREDGQDGDILQYALEWAFFTRCQWGEYDTALYELERCWGRLPESPSPIGAGGRPATERVIRSLDDVHAAVEHYLTVLPYEALLAHTTHISTDLGLRLVSKDEMAAALARRASAGPQERDIYASYVNELFLTGLEQRNTGLVFQFSYGAEPLPYETASRLTQESIRQLAEMISRHPGLHFQCFLANRHTNQSLCTMCRELPNFSLSGYWWHNFFPSAMRQLMEERLEMLPVNKQMGFFSDAYVVEWAYAKAVMVRTQLAEVLAQKVRQGQYTLGDALQIARAIFYESPQEVLKMKG